MDAPKGGLMRQLFRTALILFLLAFCPAALAALPYSAGPYQGQLWTDPPVIPVDKAQIYFTLRDDAGNPVENATVQTLAKMPGMDMGEKEVVAKPVSGQPGTYSAPAAFPMAGLYEITLEIAGAKGAAIATVSVKTGQNTGGPTGQGQPSKVPLFLFIAALLLFGGFVLYRMHRTGQRIHAGSLLNRGTLGGLLLLALMTVIALYAVNRFRRPNAMTPIEAQAMEMNTPAPPGVAAVELATVERGPIRNTVRYTGSAVGYTEQNITPRVQGWLTWMPIYAGDRVVEGQLIARLDTSQSEPQVAERRAGVNMAQQGVDVARTEYRQSLAEVNEARADLAGRGEAISEARAMLEAARQERSSAVADLAAAESRVADARAGVAAAQADYDYWQDQLKRLRALVNEGAISREEFQREQAQAENAAAKVRQARAGVAQAQAEVRAAQAGIRKADAMIRAAQTRIRQSQSEQRATQAKIRSAQAAADAARRRIGQAQAGVEQAQASLGSATATRGYSEIRSPVDGVVTRRVVSPGQLVSPGQVILEIAEIRPIRLQANVPEADLAKIEVGAPVTIRERNGGGNPLSLKVTSITPAVDPQARTGIVEAVYGNEDNRFRPGEFVEMEITTDQKPNALWIPSTALQTRTLTSGRVLSTQTSNFVWVAEPASGGEYTVKPVNVKTGLSSGERTEIVFGLEPGQRVVTSGTVNLREGDTVVPVGERLAEAPEEGEAAEEEPGTIEAEPVAEKGQNTASEGPGVQSQTITLTASGYEPANIDLKPGVPAKLTFIREMEGTCGEEVVLPDYNIKRKLPLNQPVTIEFTPKKGEFKFTCGMEMLVGKVVVR